MKKFKFLAIGILSVLILSSCGTSLAFKETMKLKKGMGKHEVMDILDKEEFIYDINGGSKDTYDISEMGLIMENNVDVIIKEKYRAETEDYYVLGFVDDKLIYWGYPIEFTRSNNALINDIGFAAIDVIKKHIEN